MKKVVFKILIITIICMIMTSTSFAIEDIRVPKIQIEDIKNDKITKTDIDKKDLINSQKEAFKIDDYIGKLQEYSTKDNLFDLNSIAEDLLAGKGIKYDTIFKKVIGFLGNEILVSAKGFIAIFAAIILLGIVKSIQTDTEGSSIYKIVYFATYILIATMVISTFMSFLEIFKNTITTLISIVQIVTPFLMTLLLATGSITTTGIISPIILFVVQLIGFLINAVVIPFIILSLVFNIVSNISDKVKLSKISKLFSKSALWIIGTTLTVFLCIISLEGNLSSSIDGVLMKTMQAGVANVVPVVGKFFSDSLEAVVGAGEIIKNVAGVISIVVIIGISIFPVLKLLVIMLMFKLLSVIVEPITDAKISTMLRRLF